MEQPDLLVLVARQVLQEEQGRQERLVLQEEPGHLVPLEESVRLDLLGHQVRVGRQAQQVQQVQQEALVRQAHLARQEQQEEQVRLVRWDHLDQLVQLVQLVPPVQKAHPDLQDHLSYSALVILHQIHVFALDKTANMQDGSSFAAELMQFIHVHLVAQDFVGRSSTTSLVHQAHQAHQARQALA